MSDGDSDDSDSDEYWEKQRHFVKEAHGMSDDDIDELIDAVIAYRKNAEDHLDEDEFEGEVAQELEDKEQERFKLVGQDGPVNIYEVDGRKMVPYDQVIDVMERINKKINNWDKIVDDVYETLSKIDSANTDRSEQYLSDETWQAVEDLKKDPEWRK